MKKKTKLFGTLTALYASICMMVVGVLAASQVSLNVTSSVSFDSNGAYVKVKGEVQKGNANTEPTLATEPENSDYYYIGYSYDAVDEELETDTQASDYNDTPVGTSSYTPMTAWTIGNVEFSETESIIRYSLTFTNYSEKPVQATITTNKDTFLSDPNVQGKVSINETSNSVIIDGYDGLAPQTATYSITLTLTNFSSSFSNVSLTIDVNFSTEIVEQEVEELVPGLMASVIEGTNNVEITGYSGFAQNIVIPESFSLAEKELPSSFVWEDASSTPVPPETAQALFFLGDFNLILGNGTNRELINYYEFNLEMKSGTIGVDDFPMTFEQTFNLKIEYNEFDLEMLMGYVQFISDPSSMGLSTEFIFELPKVKENDSNDWIGFQDLEAFTEYANTIFYMGENNFPLDFQISSPKYMAMVEGDEYTITSIGDDAFRNCSSLASIVIPSSVTSIGSFAFSGCSSLASVTFGVNSQLTSIGNNAFYECSSLTIITIPNDVVGIGSHAFYDCTSLASIEIPSSVTSIGSSAFDSCSLLQITVASDNTNYSSDNGSLYNKAQTELIRGAGGVSTGTILDTVTSIGEWAFRDCTLLESIEIPSSVTSIGSYAFLGCSSLENIEIPSSVRSIGISTFDDCSSLASVTFGVNSQLTSIYTWAFRNCSSLVSVEIPSSVTSIGDDAFAGCSSLKYIKITGNLNSAHTLPSGTWVRTDTPDMPTDWTTNVVTSIPAGDSIGYYHQQSAWQNAG